MAKSPIALVATDDMAHILDAEDDEFVRVEALVAAASARIETFCQRPFKSRTVTLTLDGDGRTTVDLGGTILSVTDPVILGYGDGNPQNLTQGTDYKVVPQRGQLFRAVGWMPGVQNIRVVASIGYVDADIPQDVVEACRMLVKRWWDDGPGTGGFLAERIGEYSYQRPQPTPGDGFADIPPDVQAILLGHRRWTP